MIHRRLSANLRTQNWTAIGIDFVLLVLGVYLGLLAANWNQQRLEQREIGLLLTQLGGEMARFDRYLASLETYYRVTGRYGEVARRGWEGDPSVSDRDFVIAAYQSTQINGAANNATVWAAIFGMERLRDIEDPVVRDNLAQVMTFDYNLVALSAVITPYREEVRTIIPDEIQSAVRAQCGDRPAAEAAALALPARCDIAVSDDTVKQAAAMLRAKPELLSKLNWHRAAIATQMANVRALQGIVSALANELAPRS
jgi:hypothetical protein